jgi:hypothetical protein
MSGPPSHRTTADRTDRGLLTTPPPPDEDAGILGGGVSKPAPANPDFGRSRDRAGYAAILLLRATPRRQGRTPPIRGEFTAPISNASLIGTSHPGMRGRDPMPLLGCHPFFKGCSKARHFPALANATPPRHSPLRLGPLRGTRPRDELTRAGWTPKLASQIALN